METGKIILILGPMFSGKCLGKDTEVLMHDGNIKLVQNITEGELIMGDDSSPRKVLSTCSGSGELFKVVPALGNPYVVNKEHILSLKCCCEGEKCRVKSGREYRKGEIVNISVGDYLDESEDFRNYFKGYKVPVEFSEKEVPLDPYIFGVWLGCGNAGPTATTNIDREIMDVFEDYIKKKGSVPRGRQKIHCLEGPEKPDKINFFLQALVGLNVRKNERVPLIYKANTRDVRLKVLAGLVDAAGYYQKDRRGYEIMQKSKKLSDDILFLARSLGFGAHLRETKKSRAYKGEINARAYYRIGIAGNNLRDIPCLLDSKKIILEGDDLSAGIKIEPVGEGEYFGFEIDGNKLFLLGDFTATHNTSELIRYYKRYRIAGKRCLVVKYAGDDRYDESSVVTHDKVEIEALPVNKLREVEEKVNGYDVICVDEIQFFEDGVLCDGWANQGKIVVASGLNGTFQRKPWKVVSDLIPLSDDIIHLKAICRETGGDAPFTSRILDREGEIVIGGPETYSASDRETYRHLKDGDK